MKSADTGQQIMQALQTVQQTAPQVDLSYFVQSWSDFYSGTLRHGSHYAAVIGTGVPEIYIRACGLTPIYLFGGDYCSNKQETQFFPPVSDPAIQSAAVSFISKGPSAIAAVVLSPENTDALKALAYLRKSGLPILTLEREIMPQNTMPSTYRDAQMSFLLQLESISRSAPTADRLHQEAALSTQIHWLLRRLDKSGYPQALKAFIRQSFYWVYDREEWARQVKILLAEAPPPVCEDILLIGSPIYFPNSKIYSILGEVGLVQYHNFCSAPYPTDYSKLCQTNDLPSLLDRLHQIHYELSRNDACALYGGAVHKASGVIFHLLKGQLKYAYEAELVEKNAIRQGIPFICVETDYSDADHEQVKIRLEGFAELLRQKHIGGA